MAFAMPHGRDACAYIRRGKNAPNKKRPELLRVLGRPNSPPPGLLTYEGTFLPPSCKSHLRAKRLARTGHMEGLTH